MPNSRELPLIRLPRAAAFALIGLIAASLLPASSAFASWMVPNSPYTAKDFTMVKRNGVYHLFYILNNSTLPLSQTQKEFGHATSADLYFWTQQPTVLPVRPGLFDAAHVWAPSIVERDGVYYMFYTGVADSPGVHNIDQRTGIATSTDLNTWNRMDLPVRTCEDVPWSWCDSLAAVPFRDPMVVADSLNPNRWWMVQSAARADDPGGMVVALGSSDGDFGAWQDEGWIPATDRSVTFSDLAESPHLFHHDGLWFLFFTTNSGQPLSFATTPDPLTAQSEWTGRGRLSAMLGYDTSTWFASEFFRDGLVNYFMFVNGDRVEIEKMAWTAPDRFSLVQPDLFHVQKLTWGWGSVQVGSTVTLYIQSKWWSGRSLPLECFWVDSLDVWHPIANADLGMPSQIPLTADTTPYVWTARALPASANAPPDPRIVVRVPDQTATSNLLQLVPVLSGEPDPDPWGGGSGGGSGPTADGADNPKLRTLKVGLFAAAPSVVVEIDHAQNARLDVYDLQGRALRNLADRELPAGATVHTWDGRDAGGRHVGPGVYFVRLATAGHATTVRVLLR